ncbi:IS4/Tn5 family transposase DNA-binding protein [Bradyrhizobium glycinis]|uniref:IS4/Tn5 family transposase DNA-binding protein n=1 Tax=Bradyrhizobium glycinis TaxID=2751812 RepID=UPI001FE81C48|nr:transposase DNA-binding-containing protein [Bradyrhizobium glycinis]
MIERVVDASLGARGLGDRFRKLLSQIGSAMGQSIPLVCQDWANTMAAYRFFSNDRVTNWTFWPDVSDRHVIVPPPLKVSFLCCTIQPSSASTREVRSDRHHQEHKQWTDKAGRLRPHTVCGILMHSSLAVTIEGVPLGLAAVKFWTRKKFNGTAALKKKINPTRIPIEKRKASGCWKISGSLRNSWIIRDDASLLVIARVSIYELFCAAQERSEPIS